MADSPETTGAPIPAGPAYRSRFGGLWTDLSHAEQLIAGKLELGWIDERLAERLRFWIQKGYVVLEGSVSHELVDRVFADVDRAWEGTDPLMCAEMPTADGIQVQRCSPEKRTSAAKLLNMHAFSDAVREAIFVPELLEFLSIVFERPPMAFATLTMEKGTRQPIHQDTAFVGVSSPMELAASWIALEDITGRCGQLEYYEGSHRIPETIFDNGQRIMPQELRSSEEYFYHLQKLCSERGLPLVQFSPKKGDVLIWSADLVHGGHHVDVDENATRKSLVTHYCPIDRDPEYFAFWKHSGRLRHDPTGAYYCYYTER